MGRVLVVDDDRSALSLLSGVLERDFTVTTASSGAEALELLAASPVDLILLDMMMPDMDGLETCAAIKADSRTAEVPVIFITGMEDEDAEEAALDAGAVDFISKPIKPRIVESRVRLQLQNYLYLQFLEKMLREKSSTLESLREESRALLASIGLERPN